MPHIELITTLVGGLAAALVLGYATHRIGLSPIVGYLLAGVVVGPNTPGFVANKELADQFAEIGVILLMFGVGLHFHVEHLLAVRSIAIPGAIGQSLVATALGAAVAMLLGWGWSAGIVYGLAVSVASTVVLLRVLSDNNELHTRTGHIAVGWLIVEDLFTVFVLVLLPVIFANGDDGRSLPVALGLAAVKITVLLALVIYGGDRVIPWILDRIANTRSRELFTLTVILLALGIAVGSALLFGVSMALGAFLAGTVVGRSDFSARAASEALPMRDAFAVLFFVSVGMLFDPAELLRAPGAIAATLAIIMVGKPLAALLITIVLGYPLRTAISVALVLAQVGEFSFILGTLGLKLEILPHDAMQAIVAAAILSISVNPLLYRLVDRIDVMVRRRPGLRHWLKDHEAKPESGAAAAHVQARSEAIVVGFGPVGRTLVRLLRENEIEPTVVELNLETVRRLRAQGTRAVYGDATHEETLREAGIERASTIFLTSSATARAHEIIQQVREANKEVRIYARTNYLTEVESLRKAGADAVFADEGEQSLTMTEFLLRQLGALDEQIDRERHRIRSEQFGGEQQETRAPAR